MAGQNLQEMFNTKFLDLVKDLVRVFPEDKDFKTWPTALRLAIMADESLIYKVFNVKATPFKDRILAKDESFFLTNTYEDLTEGITEANDIIGKLKHCWGQLSDPNKVMVWKYLHLLILLNDRLSSGTT